MAGRTRCGVLDVWRVIEFGNQLLRGVREFAPVL